VWHIISQSWLQVRTTPPKFELWEIINVRINFLKSETGEFTLMKTVWNGTRILAGLSGALGILQEWSDYWLMDLSNLNGNLKCLKLQNSFTHNPTEWVQCGHPRQYVLNCCQIEENSAKLPSVFIPQRTRKLALLSNSDTLRSSQNFGRNERKNIQKYADIFWCR